MNKRPPLLSLSPFSFSLSSLSLSLSQCTSFYCCVCRPRTSFGLYFVVYETITRRFGKSDTVSFYAGGFSGVAAWVRTYSLTRTWGGSRQKSK